MNKLESILPELLAISQTDLRDNVAVRAGAYALESMLLHDPNLLTPEITLPMTDATLVKLNALYEQFETDMEERFAGRLLSGEVTLPEYHFYGRFRRLVRAETELANITANTRVLFIGSGPFPITPILLAEMTGCSVNCYDRSEDAAGKSQEVIDKLGLAEQIEIYNLAGEESAVDYSDVISIALLAQPKEQILQNIRANGSPGQKVILRYSEGVRRLFYKGIDRSVIANEANYEILGEHHAGEDDTISTLVAQIRQAGI